MVSSWAKSRTAGASWATWLLYRGLLCFSFSPYTTFPANSSASTCMSGPICEIVVPRCSSMSLKRHSTNQRNISNAISRWTFECFILRAQNLSDFIIFHNVSEGLLFFRLDDGFIRQKMSILFKSLLYSRIHFPIFPFHVLFLINWNLTSSNSFKNRRISFCLYFREKISQQHQCKTNSLGAESLETWVKSSSNK